MHMRNVRVCVCVCVCVCMYICMYVCMYRANFLFIYPKLFLAY